MIYKFEDQGYIDIDKISSVRYLPTLEKGMVVIDGNKMYFETDQYEDLLKAYVKSHYTHTYDKNGKIGGM